MHANKPGTIPCGVGRRARRGAPLFAALALAAVTAGCFESKVVTSKVNDPEVGRRPTQMNGVFYALPRTVVKADVPVVKTVKERGEFFAFTPCFFPNEKYTKIPSTSFHVAADRIKFDTTFIPDAEEVYLIKTRGGMFETRNLELELTERGVLVKASADVTNEAIDIVTGTIKTGVGVLAKASGAGLFSGTAADKGNFAGLLDEEQRRCRELLVQQWDDDINNAATPEEKLLLQKARPEVLDHAPGFKQEYEKAKQIAANIDSLQKRRHNDILDTAVTPASVPADTLKLVLEELDKSITTLMEANFTGTKSTLTWNASFRLNPDNPGKMSIDLFTLSKDYGVCQVHVNQGVKLDDNFTIKKRCKGGALTCKPNEMEPVDCNAKGQKVWLAMQLGEDGEGGPSPAGSQFADVVRDAQLRRNGDRGFYYRIPGSAIAFIMKQTDKPKEPDDLARAPLSIAQFGEVVSLPASTGGRKTKYTLALYEASGGLKNFVMGSSALVQQKNIDDVAAAATTAIEAKGERNKAKAPADELQQLERQRKILEEKKKIRELENELTPPPPNSNQSP